MKCPKCGGTGEMQICEMGFIGKDECDKCHGKGYLNNEEWLRQANTEQLVQVIHLMTTSCYVCGKDGVDYKRCYFHKKCTGPKEIEEWLKEPHTPFP